MNQSKKSDYYRDNNKPVHNFEPAQDTGQRLRNVKCRSLNPQTLEFVVLVDLPLVHWTIVLEARHIVHLIELGDFLRHMDHGLLEQWLHGNRFHFTDLNELSWLSENGTLWWCIPHQDLSLWKLGLQALRKRSNAFVFQAAIHKLLILRNSNDLEITIRAPIQLDVTYSHKQWETHAVEAHAEIFRFQAELGQNVLEEFRLQNECMAQAIVVEAFGFVEDGQFLAQRNALFPAFAFIEILQNLRRGET